MSRSHRSKGPVPSRWMHCPRKASDLIINKFMAFKTPLNEAYDNQVPPDCRFPPKMLFDLCKSKKITFGLWIDLTNTNRFYNKQEIEEQDCSYVKLQCRGHGETPSREQTNTFISLVHTFVSKHPLECIAVHCTHGFNRSGFLIVSYLIEKMDFGIEVALQMFAHVRPPGIYKDDYLKELYQRYDDVDDCPPAPSLPDWCYDDDANDDGSGYESSHTADSGFFEESTSSSSSSINKKVHRKKNGKIPVFMEGVPGVEVFNEQPKASHDWELALCYDVTYSFLLLLIVSFRLG